jgi:hypothetical protein
MLERRQHQTLRPRFDALKRDLLRRLARVSPNLPAAERDELAARMTRLRVRYEYRELLQR